MGIVLIKQKEYYSSQCPPDTPKVSKKYATKNNRKYRGLYITKDAVYNAYCVGAYNILRLYL
jgi:putative transposase